MEGLIGNTPLIKINYLIKGKKKHVYAKLESYNLTGSIKDRMVDYILKKSIKTNELKENMPLIEATSGNTGISLAALGAYYKHPVHIFIPDFVSKERLDLLRLYGANIHLVTKEEGGYEACIQKADALAKKINGYRLNQFERKENIMAHYETTGRELVEKLDVIDGFVSGIGTGGTLMGCTLRIKEKNPHAKITVIEPKNASILLSHTENTYHQIEGIADGFLPHIVEKEKIDHIILVEDEDALLMSQKLSSTLGLGTGISSGANLIGSILLNEQLNGEICTVFPDDNKKYLSTNLGKKIEEKEKYISPLIEFINYEIL